MEYAYATDQLLFSTTTTSMPGIAGSGYSLPSFANLMVPADDYEADTYSLIPNGWTISPSCKVRAFFIEHDQSGATIPWMGRSTYCYIDYFYSEGQDGSEYSYCYFDTFLSWTRQQRKKWKERQYTALKITSGYDFVANTLIKENNMYTTANTAAAVIQTTPPVEVDQRKYLLKRLENSYYDKERAFHAEFKLNPVDGPKTVKDLVAKIKAGDYTLLYDWTEEAETWGTAGLLDYIRWSKETPDRDGFDAAMKKTKEAKKAATDTITILSPEEGLKALQEFEAATFH